MKIVVTGATGFIGRTLVQRLLPDHDVFCLTRQAGALPAHPRLHAISQDLSQPLDAAHLPQSADAVIHLAQSRHFRAFPEQARDIFKVNTEATHHLLEYGRRAKIRMFLLASTGGVCGYLPRPILETDPPAPSNFYLASKYAAECLVNAYGEFFAAVNLRYFFVYGDGQRGMFMPTLVERVLEGKPITVSGKSGVSMNPVYVSDAVEATLRALELERPETINIGGTETTTVLDLAELIGRVTGKKPVYQREPDKGPLAMVGNIEKMKFKLGVTPKVSLEEGVGRLVKDIMDGMKGTAP
jgi:UDP-glucose 4-epimerase